MFLYWNLIPIKKFVYSSLNQYVWQSPTFTKYQCLAVSFLELFVFYLFDQLNVTIIAMKNRRKVTLDFLRNYNGVPADVSYIGATSVELAS